MAISVATWNLERGGLADPERSRIITNAILMRNADVMVLPEAYNEDSYYDLVDVAKQRFMDEGRYHVFETRYDDADDRNDRRAMLMLNRHPAGEPDVMRLQSRNAVIWPTKDFYSETEVNIAGVHLDDRSEAARVDQVTALLENKDIHMIAGDLNALHFHDARSIALRALRPLAERLPRGVPGLEANKLLRLGSLAARLTEMGDGTTLHLLQTHGFRDADGRYQATKGPMQLDHLLHTDGFESELFRTIPSPRTADNRPVSDHRMISAYIGAVD